MKKAFVKRMAGVVGILLSVTIFISCLGDEYISIKEPDRYSSTDIKSYADIFKVFWTTMDQQYNYFLEQYQRDGMDWDMVYTEYYPKFAALKTFGRVPGVTNEDVQRDTDKAREYFREIMEPILDRHFRVTVRLPSGNSKVSPYSFSGGIANYPAVNPYWHLYMPDRLTGDTISIPSLVIAGNLLSNPDIYYFGLKRFNLKENFNIDLFEKYLVPYSGNKYILRSKEIDTNTYLRAIQDAGLRNRVGGFTKEILSDWNRFFNSKDVRTFNDNVTKFKTSEVISEEFLNVAQALLDSSMQMPAYNDSETYSSISSIETEAYLGWFMKRMWEHLEKGYEWSDFQDAASLVSKRGPFYKKFLNPLSSGAVKKLIIDVRGNGGGSASDLIYFASRLVTKATKYGYQRLKEGNGRFNYTPWAPMFINPHPFAIPSKIPVVILTDFRSASTSEIATVLLKSQGEHIISVGDYTRGATAGLATDSDDFNANSVTKVAGGFLKFYMPIMAFKDENGKIIEGIGIEPDISVEPLSDNEVTNIFYDPKTFVDRVLDKAVEELSK